MVRCLTKERQEQQEYNGKGDGQHKAATQGRNTNPQGKAARQTRKAKPKDKGGRRQRQSKPVAAKGFKKITQAADMPVNAG